MIVPIIEPSNPATIMNMKYPTDNVIPLIRKLLIPSSGVMKAGEVRKRTKKTKKNIELKNPPINAGPVSAITKPIGIATITGKKNRYVDESSHKLRVTKE